jgi:hypothetical protein
MSAAAMRRRLERLEARRLSSGPEVPPTVAERITRFLRTKHILDCERYGHLYGHEDPPEPFDWSAILERTRRMLIDRGQDPDARY